MDNMKSRMEAATAKARLLEEALKSGAYQKFANDQAQLTRQLEKLNQEARRQELVAQYGRIGAAVVQARDRLTEFTRKLEAVGTFAGISFGIASASLLGFVRAGLQGTGVGAQLNYQMQVLSREITQLFLPAIRFVIDKLQQVNQWFRSLSGAQQEQYGRWVLITLGVLAAIVVLTKLIAVAKLAGAALMTIVSNPVLLGFALAAAAIGTMIYKLQELKAMTANVVSEFERFQRGEIYESDVKDNPAFKRIQSIKDEAEKAKAIEEEIAAGLKRQEAAQKAVLDLEKKSDVGLGWAIRTGEADQRVKAQLGEAQNLELLGRMREALQKGEEFKPLEGSPGKGRNELAFGGKGFESVAETFKRIQVAALKTGPGVDEQQLSVLREIRDNQRQEATEQLRRNPAVTN